MPIVVRIIQTNGVVDGEASLVCRLTHNDCNPAPVYELTLRKEISVCTKIGVKSMLRNVEGLLAILAH